MVGLNIKQSCSECKRKAKCCFHPVNPVFAVVVADAAIEGVWREDDDEMSRVADAIQKVVVEFARPKFLDVKEYGETAQLEVNFQ